MRRIAQLLGVLALLLMAVPLAQAQPVLSQNPAFVPDQLLITLQPGYVLQANGTLFKGNQQLQANFSLNGALNQAELLSPRSTTYLLHLKPGTPLASTMAALQKQPGIRSVERNAVMRMMAVPNDPIYQRQWGLPKIGAEQAWDITTGSEIVIAIIDTGVSPSHPDLAGRVLPGFNSFNDSRNANDDEGHGTAMAGIAAAAGNNGQGVAGMCWSCRILPIKVLNSDGAGSADTVIKGMYWAADNGAQIISMSLGGEDWSQAQLDAVNYIHSKGIPMFASSGNSGADGNPIIYPAAFPHVIAVGATAPNDSVAGFSSYGDYLDVAAPGVGIWTTVWFDGQDTYGAGNGTSPACPFVAGLAALAKTVWPELTADQLEQLITGSAVDVMDGGKDPYTGWGRIDALKTLQNAQARYLPTPGGDQPAPPPPDIPVNPPPPPPPSGNPAFVPVPPPPLPELVGERYFPETGHTLRGEFFNYWERNGGLAVFGYPLSEEFTEQTPSGTYTVQYFERQRFEFHPEKQYPYNVLLGRMGDSVLQDRGVDWWGLPRGTRQDGCRFFDETQHSLCGEFLKYWNTHGLADPNLTKYEQSLQLFGFPISEPRVETNAEGDTVMTQWFERARLEYHDDKGILLGLLAKESAEHRGWR